ncbi:MAG: acetate--CoA ligase family protein, partial [Acetobacteraceae bacterium]|nr:acetate--CoA ligase family protein [Acetobacteraceae bacterium]
EPYARERLARLITPGSVAVIGVSERAGAFGSRVMANMAGFDGRLYQVNGKYQELGGRACHPSLAALPEVPDCVVVAAGRDAVEPIVAECARLGVGAVVILAAGFAETGKPEHVALQARLVAMAGEADMRLVGPNTIGLVNYAIGAGLTFSAMPDRRALAPHAIGIVSQSGSLGFALSQAVERGVSVSHVLTAGNSCDVDVADEVAYLATDPHCRAIACVFEGMADPGRMIAAAERAWAADKPLVMYKMATGEEGARAALSHTGSLAGSEAAYRAAFARAGVIQVDALEALVEAASFFAKAPPPTAPGVAVIATSGGACIMAADKAERHGVALPQPGPEAAAVLAVHIPEFGSTRNPCDVTAQAISDAGGLAACTQALLSDPVFGALVTTQGYAYAAATARLPTFAAAARDNGKIVCSVWVPEWFGGPGAREIETDPHLCLFHSMDRCFAVLAAWRRRHAQRQRRREEGRLSPPEAAGQARALLHAAGRSLTEREAKRIAALYGIPVVHDEFVTCAEAAAVAAAAIGFPVVLKGEHREIQHKTEAGLVRLDLRDDKAVRAAAAAMLGTAGLTGLLVQPMVGKGVEIMVGARVDPQFGPLVVVGLGGVFVELLRDTALALAPVTPDEALAMLGSLKAAAVLEGFRGSAPVDRQELANIVARFSELAADLADEVSEMEINPLIASGDRIIAVDALIVRA